MHTRRFRRVPFATEVTLKRGQNTWKAELLDVALKGAMLETKTELPFDVGAECTLCITLPGASISMEFQANLVHHEENHYGFKFISEDLNTLTHLRKLIELNTGDADATRTELSSWLGN